MKTKKRGKDKVGELIQLGCRLASIQLLSFVMCLRTLMSDIVGPYGRSVQRTDITPWESEIRRIGVSRKLRKAQATLERLAARTKVAVLLRPYLTRRC